MKRVLLGILAIMALLMSGCGGSSVTVVVPVIEPPTITSYEFTQDRAEEFIQGSLDFTAPDSDIDTISIVVFGSRGNEISRTTTAVDLPEVTSGTILFSIDYITFPNDTYTFSIILTDFNGHTSNEIVDTFSVP